MYPFVQRSILFLFIALGCGLPHPLHADHKTPCPVLCKYTQVNEAQVNVLRRQRDIQAWKLENIESLQERGFASWMEVRRQRFAVDSADQKIQYFVEFADFVADVRDQIEEKNQPYGYDENAIKAVRVFMPGSNRIVGWLEGHQLQGYSVATDLKDAKFELELSDMRLERLKKQLETTKDEPQWLKKCQLSIDLAAAQQRARQLTVDYLTMLNEQIERDSNSNDRMSGTHRTLEPGSDQEFQRLVINVANAEVNSQSQLELVKRHLQREQQRLDSLEKLALHGHATKKEIKQLQQHVNELRAARDQIARDKSNLKKSLTGIVPVTEPNKQRSVSNVSYLDVKVWPAEVTANASFVQYLVEQRRAYYQEQVKRSIANQQQEMFDDILGRLRTAAREFAKRNVNGDRFSDLLEIGQRKEIEGFEWKKESLDRLIEVAQEKLQVLVLEEHRFLRQAVLMSELPVASSHPTDNNLTTHSVDLIAQPELLVSLLTPPAGSNVSHSATPTVRFGYVESNIYDTVGDAAELLLLQNPGLPLGLFETHNELLRPVALTQTSRALDFAYSRPIRIQAGKRGNGTPLSFTDQNRNRGSSPYDLAAPSLYNSPFATDQYRNNQVRQPRFFENAYPFGILRSELRRFTTYGQSPWYLPGSPNNLRYNQLQTDFRRSPAGAAGSKLLKSNNYLDLSRPLSQ